MHVYTVTTLASNCQYCYHTGKCLSILLPHWQVYVSTVTTLASVCLYCNNTGKYMSAMLPHGQVYISSATTLHLASACLYCYHTGKYLSVLLPHWQEPVYTYHTGKYISVVSTVTTLASICQCYKYNLIGKYLNCEHTGNYLSILLPNWQVYVSSVTTLASI